MKFSRQMLNHLEKQRILL